MIIKIILLCTNILALSATDLVETSLHNTGISSTEKHQDSHGNYAFSYDIVDKHGARNSRTETGDAFGTKKGSYTLYDVDGRARVVDYIADEHGFRVVVNTNEPGTAQSYPAGAIINSPYKGPVAPVAEPVSIAHEVPVSVPDHITQVSYPTKSVIAHTAPVTVAHAVSPAYSSKSIISHDVPVAVSQGVSIPHDNYLSVPFSVKSVVSHPSSSISVAYPSPLTHSTKSVLSHVAPVKTVVHAPTFPITNHHSRASYSPKSVISNVVPIAKHYRRDPFAIGRYKSFYNRNLGYGGFGYSHGLLGHSLGGLAYDSKLYNHRLQGQGVRGLLYGNSYNNGYQRYGHGNFDPYIGELTYGNSVHGYNGLKSYYY